MVAEADLLAYVYGGAIPPAVQQHLVKPLLADARLERDPRGQWSLRGAPSFVDAKTAFTALALAATGATPGRARLVRVVALHVEHGHTVERLDVILNPQVRVPRYVAARAGLDTEVLDAQPTFADVLGDVIRFLGERPVVAQDAELNWALLSAEARACGHALVQLPLVDVNDLARHELVLKGKPTLASVAAHFDIGSAHTSRVDEEARLLAQVGERLLALGAPPGTHSQAAALRRGTTARALPDEPGVYVLRDAEQQPLYVGKARRLRSRVAAYVHRPIGPTRRLEGLVGSVEDVDTTQCQTDLEALVLEDREIRRLQPRFNTVRRQRTPRYWIRLPPERQGKNVAPRRLELSTGPGGEDGEFVGPFRNEMLAQQARQLARDVFALDALRRSRSADYANRLSAAWQFLHGHTEAAETLARAHSVTLLRQVLGLDVAALLLPADPRHARYAVIRPAASGLEGFLVDKAICVAWVSLDRDGDAYAFARALLERNELRTTPEDADVVLRWFGAQRPPARLVLLPDDPLAAADAIEDAVFALVPET